MEKTITQRWKEIRFSFCDDIYQYIYIMKKSSKNVKAFQNENPSRKDEGIQFKDPQLVFANLTQEELDMLEQIVEQEVARLEATVRFP